MSLDKKFSIVIADDHPMLLKGLMDELSASNYNVVGQATNGVEALEIVLTQKPSLALLDIDMPFLTGFEVIRMAREKGSETKFIILSFHKDTEYVAQAKSLDISGYLLKEDSFQEIEKCMKAVLAGKEFFSSSFDAFSLNDATEELRKLKFLTPSETTILKLIAKQTTSMQIAEILSVSSRTVEKHRSNIKEKLSIEGGNNALTSWCLTNKNLILDL